MLIRKLLIPLLLLICQDAFSQSPIQFNIANQFFSGIKVLKVKRDFNDPYVWVLAINNQIYRINSLNQAVDNYTPTFSQYNNLQFIDIAGASQDTVFIATNSTNIIQYKNGAMKLIGATQGIIGEVTSIGFDNLANLNNHLYQPPLNHILLDIGTTNGMFNYYIAPETLKPDVHNPISSQIYEATYRSFIHSGPTPLPWQVDTLASLSVEFNYDPTISEFLASAKVNNHYYGPVVNTAFYTPGLGYSQSSPVDANILYWGSNQGMFETNANQSGNPSSGGYTYLAGININKITSIYGLTTFGDASGNGIQSNNLLIGTNLGLYFSSTVWNYTNLNQSTNELSIYKYDGLGNVRINDICVNAAKITSPECEDGVWVAADNGLYYLTPNYANSLDPTSPGGISFQNQPNTVSHMDICQGSSATLSMNYQGSTVKWFKDGSQLAGQYGKTLTVNQTGDYYAMLYDPCGGYHLSSNHLTVTIINSPVFNFNYPDKIQQCNNNPYTLQVADNPAYHYRWYTNGVLNGNTTNSYTVTQTGKYYVEVSACTNSWVPSSQVEVDLIDLPVPRISADKAVYCAEDVATLSINTPLDPFYSINWYQDGNLIAADNNLTSIQTSTGGNYTATITSTIGTCTQTSTVLPVSFTPAPVFTFNYPDQLQYCAGTPLTLAAGGSNGYQYRWYKNDVLNNVTTASLSVTEDGSYKVEVSSCTGSWVASKEVQVAFISLPMPVIVADKPAYCSGDIATLSLSEAVDPDLGIHWYKDNVLIPTSPGQTFITTNLPDNYTVSVVNNTLNTDGTTCSQTSTGLALVFNPPPTISIKQTVNTTLCTGQTVSLAAIYSGGTVQWSTGETTTQISVTQSGTYKVTVTSPAGCQADASIDVNFYSLPVFTVKDTSVCTYKKQIITLTGPSGFTAYDWNNGQSTSQTFQVSQPGIVSLTVTDANGCQATRQIKVSEQCATVYIPNTFTPNGDGVNDTWVIEGLDETATVKVYTRWGSEVYQSVGYSSPWNGEYAGKKLATGVYYYLVTAKNGAQKFSGSLTIIY